MKKSILGLVMALMGCGAMAQTVTSSPLPIVLIQTDNNATIPDDYKVPGTMTILYVDDSTTNYVSNQNNSAYIHYQGRIGIEKRGSTSQNLSKRHYGFETRQADDVSNDNVSLFGFPAENDWTLNPLNYDNSYLRDPLSYALANRTGHYASRTFYCEVFVGGNYRGIYSLCEKIKVDKGRVNLEKMDSTANALPAVTGGYIIKADKTTGGDPVAWTTPAHSYWEDVLYIHHYPKPAEVTPAQTAYIHNYFDAFQAVMDSGNASIADGYPSMIDVPSFVDYMLIAELTSNIDIYQKSTFFHKDIQGKLCAGPAWDFNGAFGNDPFFNPGRSGYDVWQFDNDDNTGSRFWYQLYNDPQFRRLLARRWHELTAPGAPWEYSSVIALVDSLDGRISSLVARDKQRWGYTFSQTNAVNSLKTWLQNRYNWLNAQLTDTLNTLPELPALAFTKIQYNPKRFGSYPKDSMEFIAVTNLEDTTIALTGLYLSHLGLSYQFPADATIDPLQEVYIASDTAAFRAKYGVEAIGQYARTLSNSSQRLVLADAWGRVIDDVTYYDRAPWPAEADGDGPFLTLTDPYADNSIADNWSTDTTLIHPCMAPENIQVSEVGYTTALLTFEAASTQHEWVAVLSSDNGADTIAMDSTTYSFSNLMPATQYSLSVMALCDERHASEWSDSISFTTRECKAVTDLVVEPYGADYRFSFTDPNDASNWHYGYGAEGFDPDEAIPIHISDTFAYLTNLMPDRYELYVRAECEPSIVSPWSEGAAFEVEREGMRLYDRLSAALFPMPATSTISITLYDADGAAEITILDLYGREMMRCTSSLQTTHLNVSALAAGVYLVQITTPTKHTSAKIVKE